MKEEIRYYLRGIVITVFLLSCAGWGIFTLAVTVADVVNPSTFEKLLAAIHLYWDYEFASRVMFIGLIGSVAISIGSFRLLRKL